MERTEVGVPEMKVETTFVLGRNLRTSLLPSFLPSFLPSSLDEARLYSADATVYIFLCALCFFFCAAVIKLEPFFSFFCRNPSGPEILQLLSVTGNLSLWGARVKH